MKYQFVWWPHRWWKLWYKNVGAYPSTGENKGRIYQWRIVFSALEIRKWNQERPEKDKGLESL